MKKIIAVTLIAMLILTSMTAAFADEEKSNLHKAKFLTSSSIDPEQYFEDKDSTIMTDALATIILLDVAFEKVEYAEDITNGISYNESYIGISDKDYIYLLTSYDDTLYIVICSDVDGEWMFMASAYDGLDTTHLEDAISEFCTEYAKVNADNILQNIKNMQKNVDAK